MDLTYNLKEDSYCANCKFRTERDKNDIFLFSPRWGCKCLKRKSIRLERLKQLISTDGFIDDFDMMVRASNELFALKELQEKFDKHHYFEPDDSFCCPFKKKDEMMENNCQISNEDGK